MIDYQKHLFDVIESEGHEAWRRSDNKRPPLCAGITISHINGEIIASHRDNRQRVRLVRTIAVLHVDFWGSHTMRASLNKSIRPGQPVLGPNAPGVYHWTAGDPDSEVELNRMLAEWAAAIEEYRP